jgi:hypothetical protein
MIAKLFQSVQERPSLRYPVISKQGLLRLTITITSSPLPAYRQTFCLVGCGWYRSPVAYDPSSLFVLVLSSA